MYGNAGDRRDTIHLGRNMMSNILICLVIGIADGDTLTARCETPVGMENIKVRLAEIDAPEKGQAFGNRSKQHLADLCFRRSATLHPQTKDRYGRTVARVDCDGVDANVAQVTAGMAWVYDKYVIDRTLYTSQDEARTAGRGLWTSPACGVRDLARAMSRHETGSDANEGSYVSIASKIAASIRASDAPPKFWM